jgi:hypothetical protein
MFIGRRGSLHFHLTTAHVIDRDAPSVKDYITCNFVLDKLMLFLHDATASNQHMHPGSMHPPHPSPSYQLFLTHIHPVIQSTTCTNTNLDMIHLTLNHMAHAAVACKGDAAVLASTSAVAGAPPAADRFRNSMQSSTASLRYESVYATDAAGLTRAAALDGVAVADADAVVAVRRSVPGAPCLAVVVAADAADTIASRSTTSRTRSSMDTCVAAAPRRDRRPPPPPRSLGMQVTVASFRFRGSACRFMLDGSLSNLSYPLLLFLGSLISF